MESMSASSALVRMQGRASVNLGRVLKRESLFKVVFILGFVALLLAGLWFFFLRAFRFLDSFEGLGTIVIDRLFSLFFLGMGLMLAVSSVVTSYSSMFLSREVPFLLVSPLTPARIAVHKFAEAAGLSSWAFFFIIVPFAGAYAAHRGLGGWFALWTFLFSVPFVILCAGLGALGALAWARWMPLGVWIKRLGLLAALLGAAWIWWHSRGVIDESDAATFRVSRLVPGLRLASNPWLPSWWFSEGLVALGRGHWVRGGLLFGTLASTGALMGVALERLGGWTLYASWQRAQASRSTQRGRALSLRLGRRLTRLLPHDVGALLVKDVRTFMRDPMQWSQALIFFGLLAVYFANLRTFRYHTRSDYWRNMISFVNVFSVSAVTCSLASRFIYPQLSIEGQGFWILGLAPTSMKRIMMTKFVSGTLLLLAAGSALALLSSGMLSVEPVTRRLTVLVVSAIALSVGALSTGLGAVFLDLEQRNPSAIVSGFGGTLNLVLSLLFMLVAILPFGVIFHMRDMGVLQEAAFRRGVWSAGIGLALLTALFTILPLTLGLRSLRNRDY